MKFTQRLKHDKPFRIKVVLIAVVILLMYNSGGKKEAKTMEDCELSMCFGTDCNKFYNSNEELAYECTDILECKLEAGFLFDKCVPCVANSKYTELVSSCCSGKGMLASSTLGISECGVLDTCFKCIPSKPGEQCNDREQAISKVLQDMVPSLSCKNAYYITIFGAAFMAIMALGVMF